MKEIPLSQGYKALVDDGDYERLVVFRWCAQISGGHVYAKRTKRSIMMHNVVFSPPSGFIVDHKNGNTLDNRRENLRLADKRTNARNSRKHKGYAGRPCTSKFKGVYHDKRHRRWVAYINADGLRHSLGSFGTEKAAAEAYNRGARRLHGEFALLNET